MQKSWVYIVTNTDMGKLYIGVTSNLRQRIMEHKTGAHPDGFSNKYNLRRLVWYREFSNINDAFIVETRMKAWKRNWKLREIIEMNPEWLDLFDALPYDMI